ncbi:helix-turn-helix domain-containing protein [Shouchella clausii]|uniref:helix-turn-helix domain-containing protein n=1 Tax=Shouchella clausii TaxID=79880 RepID=UPI0016533697|nr:helix-turn-helix transcriptional regulator [Shouchella clausii]QNM43723.1 XRE family transcriptional regulator [Shouchella clausii]
MIRSNLKTLLDERGISIRQLAKDIDYRFESVRKLYNDDLERLPVDLLDRICDYLNINISDLLKRI